MRGRSITFKYKNFKYDNNIKNLLSTPLSKQDKQELSKIYANYEDLNVRRGYKYIIKDLYILVAKVNLSTSDIALIYDVGIRTIQIWLKELGINRTQKQAQKIAVTKRDYASIRESFKKTMLEKFNSTDSNSNKFKNMQHKLNMLLTQKLRDCEVIVGINSLGIIDTEDYIPVIIIKTSHIYKFMIVIDDNKNFIKAAKNKGYKLIVSNTYIENNNKLNLDNILIDIANQIVEDVKGD